MKVADLHCDTIGVIFENRNKGIECNLKSNNFHLDSNKMKIGDYLLQNFAMFIDLAEYKNPYETLNKMIDLYYREMEDNKEIFGLVKSYKDIEKNINSGKISSVLTIEEGGALEGNLDNLKAVYDKGVRMITLTWNYPNGIGHSNINGHRIKDGNIDFTKPDIINGLTPFGIDFIAEMERLGMIVDVSHLGDAGFYDVIKYSKKPFVASHSNARAVNNCVRNLSDDMIKSLADKGGLMGINFCADFVMPTPYKGESFGKVDDLVLHIKHIRNIGGIECIGLGSDFDGIPDNIELVDGSNMSKLANALLKNGFTYDDVERIFYKNVLNLYKELL